MNLNNPLLWSLIYTGAIIVASVLLVTLGRRLIERYVDEPERRYGLSKLTGRVVGFVALVLVIMLWSPGLNNILTILTLIGAGLAIAMREMLLSFVGWLDLLFRSPYEQGDRIEIAGVHGDVVDIRVLHTTMMETRGWVDADQSTGRLVHIPNGKIFTEPMYNYSAGFSFIWNEIPLMLTFGSDWERAREILTELAQESADIVEQQAKKELRSLARRYLIHYSILTPFVYVNIHRDGIRLTLRYLCEARKRRGTEHALVTGILRAFGEADGIEFAYDTVSVQNVEQPQFDAPPSVPSGSSPSQSSGTGPEMRSG